MIKIWLKNSKKLKFLIERKSWKIKNVKNWKLAKMGKLKWGRSGRYKNRNGPRKKVPNSWDRALSMGHVKWSVRVQEIWQMVSMFLNFGTDLSTHCCRRLILWRFFCGVLESAGVLKNQISFSKIDFRWNLNVDQKHFSVVLDNFCEKWKNDICSKDAQKIRFQQKCSKN